MVAFCEASDVEQRLERSLTSTEEEYIDGKIEAAQVLVIGYLGCGNEPYATKADVPLAVRVATSQAVADAITKKASNPAGADSVANTTGPFGQTLNFTAGSSGGVYLSKAVRQMLDPHRCDSKAFAVDTAPTGSMHPPWCSLMMGASYCSCGVDIAGVPIFEGQP